MVRRCHGRFLPHVVVAQHMILGKDACPVNSTPYPHKVHFEAIDNAFGVNAGFAQLIKIHGGETGQDSPRRYSPAGCTGIQKRPITGKPVEADIPTSHVERQNLNMRMGVRGFPRLTNAFSKKLADHICMLSLYFVYYNFVRIRKSLRTTPAMAAGLSTEFRDMEWIVSRIDARTTKPNRPKTYRKKSSN